MQKTDLSARSCDRKSKRHRGGFHIWPLGSDGDENEAAHEEDETPIEFPLLVQTKCVVVIFP